MNNEMQSQVGTFARLFLGIGAGYLVSKGKMDPAQAEAITGAALALGAGFWGYYKNVKK